MMSLPPWLNVNPLDYVNSASAGARLGLSRAEFENQVAQQNAARMSRGGNRGGGGLPGRVYGAPPTITPQSGGDSGVNLFGGSTLLPNAPGYIGYTGEKQDAASALKNQPKIFNMGGKLVTVQPDGSVAEVYSKPTAPLYKEYGGGIFKIDPETGKMETLREPESKESKAPLDTISETVTPTEEYTITQPLQQRSAFGIDALVKDIPASTNVTRDPESATAALQSGGNVSTNIIPVVKQRNTTRKVPSGKAAEAPETPAAATAPEPDLSALEGKRVRDKVTGATGTIVKGIFVPDAQ